MNNTLGKPLNSAAASVTLRATQSAPQKTVAPPAASLRASSSSLASDQLSFYSPSNNTAAIQNAAAIRFDPPAEAAPASKPHKSFIEILMDILKAIIEALMAPFKFLLGLVGIGSSGSAGPKLTASEKLNGRPVSLSASGAPDTGQFGPYGLDKYTIDIPTASGGTTPADVYVPRGQGPFPAMIHSYGLASSKENHEGTARHYASWGLVVIVPKQPHGGGSPSKNAPELSTWIQWVQSRPSSLPPLNLERGVGLSGHSFGGLSSILAGTTPGVGCIVTLDPADAFDKGEQMAAGLQVPSAFIVGEASFANQFGNGVDIYQAAGGPKQLFRIKGAQHVDFENKHDDGAKNQANQNAMRVAVSFMLSQLSSKSGAYQVPSSN